MPSVGCDFWSNFTQIIVLTGNPPPKVLHFSEFRLVVKQRFPIMHAMSRWRNAMVDDNAVSDCQLQANYINKIYKPH